MEGTFPGNQKIVKLVQYLKDKTIRYKQSYRSISVIPEIATVFIILVYDVKTHIW